MPATVPVPAGYLPIDLRVKSLSAESLNLPAGSVGNSEIEASAGILATKLQQQVVKEYAQKSTDPAYVERHILHTVYGTTGSIVEFAVGNVETATGTGNAVIKLLLNGTSIGTLTLDTGNAAYVLESMTLSTTTLADGDCLEFQVYSSSMGTGLRPYGVHCRLVTREDPE